MEIGTLIIAILAVYLFYQMGQREGEKTAERKIYQEITDQKYPYIIKEYELVYSTIYSKFNRKSLKKARVQAIESVSTVKYGKVFSEKAEIWYKGEMIECFITEHKIPIDKIQGFAFKKYNGEIKSMSNNLIDPEKISKLEYIKLKLTNGDVVSLTNPYYSIQTDSFVSKFGGEFRPYDANKSSDFAVIPLRIIEKIET